MGLILIARYCILTLSYVGLGLGYLPGFRTNRATIALIGSGFLIALGVIDLQQAWEAIDPGTIVFLLSMMVLNANLAYAGFFRIALSRLIQITRSPLGLLIVLSYGSGALSALFLNDTIALIFTPLTLQLIQAFRLNPIPYLLAIAGGTNLGSVATLTGNPQNILIGAFSGISYLNFALKMVPLAFAALGIQILLLCCLYPEVRSTKPCENTLVLRDRTYKPLLQKTMVITTALLMAFMVGVPLPEASIVAASLLLLTRRIKPERILRQVDWNLLVMFSGIFILSRCTQKLGIVEPFTDWVDTSLGLLGVTTILSNLISNVPAVLLLKPLISPADIHSWFLLAAASTFAGNLTLFGSVANLITVEAAAKLGYKLTFLEHLRFGLPLTFLTLILVYFWV